VAEQHFSWLPEESTQELKQNTGEIIFLENNHSWIVQKFLDHKTPVIVCTTLLTILLLLKFFQPNDTTSKPFRLEAMVAALAIPKGKIVEGMILRPASINPSSISKGQRLDLLTAEHAEKIVGKIRAKKDIPPNKPIFWNELELIPESKTFKILRPQVIYSEDSK
jgi:hypothetical protein